MPAPNTRVHTSRHSRDRDLEISAIFRCSGVSTLFSCSSRPAMRPTSVSMPVAVTTALPRPPAARVPAYTILFRSASGTVPRSAPALLETGWASPVSELSFISRNWLSSTRPSAAARSPASRHRMSPGTTSDAGILCFVPSRITDAAGADRFFRLSRDFWAFWCCTVPKTAFKSTTAKITAVLSTLSVTADTAAAPRRIHTSRS